MANIEAVTKKEYTSTSGQTAYNDHGIPFLNKDDIEVWITDSASDYGAGVPVLQQTGVSAGDALTNSHPQVAGTRRPALTTAKKQRGYSISSDGTDITLLAAPTTGSTVTIQRTTRDGSGKYTTFSSGSTIRHTDLNQAFDEVRYQVQEARNGIMGQGAGQAAGDNIDAASLIGTLPALDGSNLTNLPSGNLTGTLPNNSVGSAQIINDSIINEDVKTDAAIAGTKISPNFGSQAVVTTGTAATGALTVTGNIAVSGTVDGVDIANDVVTTTGSVTFTNKTIDADNNTISNLEVDNLKSGVLDTDISAVAGSDTTIPSAKAVKTYVDAQVTAQDLDLASDSGTIDIDLDSETLTVAGGTGVDTSATDTTVTVAIDSTVTTNAGTQTLTNKTIDSASNTITNIVNADIKSDAAIALTKLATGTLPSGIAVTSDNIAAGTVIASDIADDSVTHEKLKDSTDTDGDRAVTTNHIRDGAITAAKLLTTGTGKVELGSLAEVDTTTASPTDGQALVWDNTNTKWKPGTVGGAGSDAEGTLKAIKNNDSQVGGSDIETLDFSSDFTVTENPDKEIQVGIAALVATNKRAFSQNYSIPSDSNGASVGPITVNSGYAVTVPANSTWLVH